MINGMKLGAEKLRSKPCFFFFLSNEFKKLLVFQRISVSVWNLTDHRELTESKSVSHSVTSGSL